MWVIGSEGAPAPDLSSGEGRCDDPHASLAGASLSKRFCAWRGASDRRYIASVFRVDPTTADAGLPAFDTCLLMAVARSDGGRRILFARPMERLADRSAAVARGRAERADEWHLHFIADSPTARSAAAGDIAERHLTGEHADAA